MHTFSITRTITVLCCFFCAPMVSVEAFDATIPVVDLKDYADPSTRDTFISNITTAMHEVGFFGVVNTGIDEESLEEAYNATQDFFNAQLDLKEQIFNPSVNGQRGYVPSEIAQGASKKDFKEFVHIGRKNNIWPTWTDLQTPTEKLIRSLDAHSEILQKVFAEILVESEDFFTEKTATGECLLRLLHYPPTDDPATIWAAQHTDIDLFTILPIATEEGLQVLHNGKWIDVKVPSKAFIVNVGDKLQNLSNGYFKSSVHRVVAKPGVERYSIVYFVHPRDFDSVGPRPQAIALTGGVQRYPEATSLELLACRLRELGLASPGLLQLERDSGVMDRVQALVESGDAADPVKLTYELWKKYSLTIAKPTLDE